MNNNNQYGYLIVASLTLSGLAFADNTEYSMKKDYKCYLDTTSGYKIAFYEWREQDVKLNMAKLPAKKLPSVGHGADIYIKNVAECVDIDGSFTSTVAKKLDEITLK